MNFRIILGAFVLAACSFNTSCKDDNEATNNREADSLKHVAGELAGQLGEKEAAIQEFITSFNEIQENLTAIKEKEKIVTNLSSRSDVKNKQGQIREDIQAIYDLMVKNKNRLGALSEKLKNSNLKLAGMEQMIVNLQNSLNEKDVEITALKTKMEGLHIELASLNTNLRNAESENAAKTDALNTAFYAVGTAKELKEKKVIEKEGGFIGLGKSTKVSADFNKEYFTRINIEQTLSITIGAKKARLVTNHPPDSYRFVGDKPVERLDIINPKDFWGSSKYLVVMIE